LKGINKMTQLNSNFLNGSTDIDQAYKLAERVFFGDILERSKAYVEASILSYEAKEKFLQMVGQKQYHDYLSHYLCIHLNREKLQPYCTSGLISGENGNDFFIAFSLAKCSTEYIDHALEYGYIKPGMSFIEINNHLIQNKSYKFQRLTKKIKAENDRLIYAARALYLKNQSTLNKSAV